MELNEKEKMILSFLQSRWREKGRKKSSFADVIVFFSKNKGMNQLVVFRFIESLELKGYVEIEIPRFLIKPSQRWMHLKDESRRIGELRARQALEAWKEKKPKRKRGSVGTCNWPRHNQ